MRRRSLLISSAALPLIKSIRAEARPTPPPPIYVAGPQGVWKQGVTRCSYPNHAALTGSTNYRSKIRLYPPPGENLVDPTVVECNWSPGNPGEGVPINNGYMMRAAIEYPAGTMHQLYCHGSKDMVVMPGGMEAWDPCGIVIPAGTTTAYLHRRLLLGSTAEQIVNTQGPSQVNAYGEAYSDDNTTDDNTASSGYVYAHTGNQLTAIMTMPLLVLGRRSERNGGQSCVCILGDSIASGTGDGTSGGDPYGFIARAINNTRAFTYLSIPGMKATDWGKQHAIALRLSGATHAVCNMGTNDVSASTALATIKAALQAMWNDCAGAGIAVYQTTLTPKSTSTDNWATTTNQTPGLNYGPGSLWDQVNQWIRTIPSPLSGVFDAESTVGTAIGSSIWVPGNVYTTDGQGLHPSSTGHAAMALAQMMSAGGSLLPTTLSSFLQAI